MLRSTGVGLDKIAALFNVSRYSIWRHHREHLSDTDRALQEMAARAALGMGQEDIPGHINKAFKTADVAKICAAIWDAIELHNITHIAEKAGLQRSSIYRAFGGDQTPNFSTLLNVLTAMDLTLSVAPRATSPRAMPPEDPNRAPETKPS
jgi:probable addiction module antidote protein